MSEFKFNYEKKELKTKYYNVGIILLALGFVGAVLAYLVDTERAAYANVIALTWITSIGIGSIFFIAIEYVVGAVWSVPFRRVAEFLSSLILVAPLVALPTLFNLHSLFHWSHLEAVAKDTVLQNKSPYLNETFFYIRFVITFLLWFIFYYLIIRNSRKQDQTKDQMLTKKNAVISAIFLPIFAITLTFFAIDWLMSLEPHWFSTIFGIYYFAGSVLATLAAFTFISIKLHDSGYLSIKLNDDSFYSMGALLFAFTNFWAYIAFSQFMLIWYANLPEETFWYIARGEGTWMWWSLGIILVKFIVPYAILLPQPAKSDKKRLTIASVWILFGHFYDLYWLAMPTITPKGVVISWIDFVFPALVVGLVIVVFHLAAKNQNLIPIGDPKLQRGLEFKL